MSAVVVITPDELRALIREAVEDAIAERERTRPTEPEAEWLKADAAAAFLGVKRDYLRHMKGVPSHGHGRQRRWKRSELEAYLEQRGRAA